MPSPDDPGTLAIGAEGLVTERLVLRPVKPDPDAPFMFDLMNDPGWLANIGDRGIRTVDDARRYLEGYVEGYRTNGFGMYVVAGRDDPSPRGVCGLLKRPWMDDVEIGFALLPVYRGHGYAREAAHAALEAATHRFGLARVAAIVLPGNTSSVRVLEALGMRREGSVQAPDPPTWLMRYVFDGAQG